MQTIFIFILLFSLPFIHSELIQVIQIARHGARTPNSWNFIPHQYQENNGELTQLGLTQQYYMGQEMRKRYTEDFKLFSGVFNSSEVVIKSSWKNRTMRSAFAFINGLFPQESGTWIENIYADRFNEQNLLPLKRKSRTVTKEDIRRIKLDEKWARDSIEIISMDGDLYFHATKNGHCPPAEEMVEKLKKSREFKEIEKYFDLVLYRQLASGINSAVGYQMLDPEDMSIKKAKSVLDNYRCNSFHGNDHPSIDEKTLKILKSSRYYYVYKLMLLDDLVRSVQASKLFSEYLNYTTSARDGLPHAPKYVFYSAHDTNLEVLLSLFIHKDIIAATEYFNIIPFSSMLSVEVHREEKGSSSSEGSHDFFVKLFFNDEPLKLERCDDHKCPLEQFHSILNAHIIPSLEEFCKAKELIDELKDCDMSSGDVVCGA